MVLYAEGNRRNPASNMRVVMVAEVPLATMRPGWEALSASLQS
jgi:hypothetical protein